MKMIFTVGNTQSYHSAIKKMGSVDKMGKASYKEQRERWDKSSWMNEDYPGGIVFKTKEAAECFATKNKYSVFGVMADWETETEEDSSISIFNARRLLVDAKIVILNDLCSD